jgi:hypothetical protein
LATMDPAPFELAARSEHLGLQIIPNTIATRKPNDMIVASTSSRGVIGSIDAS